MKIKKKKLIINASFLTGKDKRLKMLAFIFNQKKWIEEKKRSDNFIHMDSIYKKGAYYKQVEADYDYEGDSVKNKLKNENIYSIVRESEYEPFSFGFIKDFFSQVFENSFILKNFNFEREGRTSVVWIYKKILNSFLKYFTNIDDVANHFLKELEEAENIMFIEDYGDAQYYKLIYAYIKKNKKLFEFDKGLELLSVDNKFLIIQKEKIIKQLSYRKMIYYSSSFKEATTLFS